MTNVGNVAKSPAKNRFAVIALFLVLVEAVGGLAFGLSSETFLGQQRWALLVFVALTPAVVLGVFAWLLVKHGAKLLAPRNLPTAGDLFRGLIVNPARGTLVQGRDRFTPEIIHRRTYGAEEVMLDGKRFVKCAFQGSSLVFHGTRPVVLEDISLHDVRWRLDGPAAITVNFLEALTGSGEPGRRLVEDVLDRIRRGGKD